MKVTTSSQYIHTSTVLFQDQKTCSVSQNLCGEKMSWMLRENRRSVGGEASFNGIVRRMVSLPRNIIGGFSRVMGIGRRNHHLPLNFQLQQYPEDPIVGAEEWAFLGNFEQQYGSYHPFFYACQFMETLKLAEDDHKFMFMYLHSPEHPFTPSFCRETLCSELVVQFLDANFVCWGALGNRGEGLQMAATFRPTSFPFCAVIAPAPGDSIAVLQQVCWDSLFVSLILESGAFIY